MISTLLAEPIYSSYGQFFNAYSIFVASNDSGADDPSTNTYVDSYFNSTFGSFGIERLLTIPPNDIDSNYNDGEGRVFNLWLTCCRNTMLLFFLLTIPSTVVLVVRSP